MSIQQLKYLIALDDLRHFGLAAKQCFVAQPTLTTQFKKLEEELGVQLFDRQSTPVSPTRIGEKIIGQARLILDDVAGLYSLLEKESSSISGTYVVGIIPTLAPYLLPLFLNSFAADFPGAHLIIKEMQSERIMEGLKRKQIDVGLLVTPLEEKQLREIPLYYEPFLVYAAAGDNVLKRKELLPGHIDQKDLWLLQQGHCFRNQMLNICQPAAREQAGTAAAGQRRFTFQAGSIETLKNMVKSNSGYTIIPEMSVNPELDGPHTKRFADPQPAREVSLVVNKSFSREKLLLELRNAILKVVPENFRRNERYMGIAWR